MASPNLQQKAIEYSKQFNYELDVDTLALIKQAYIDGAEDQAEVCAMLAMVDMENCSYDMLSYSFNLAEAIRKST